MKKCGYADKYKALRPPKCNGGKPCDVCREKWERKNSMPFHDLALVNPSLYNQFI